MVTKTSFNNQSFPNTTPLSLYFSILVHHHNYQNTKKGLREATYALKQIRCQKNVKRKILKQRLK